MAEKRSQAALVAEIRARLRQLADDVGRAGVERAVPGARALGIKVPVLRAQAAALKSSVPPLNLDAACALLERLATSGIREELLVGVFLVGRYGKKLRELEWDRVVSWLNWIDNWETCDQLAMGVAATVLEKDERAAARLVKLARSKNGWTRRFALATAAALNQRGRALAAPALAVCAVLEAEQDPNVLKAIGWALREASPVDAAGVERLLVEMKGKWPARVMREAAEKLSQRARARVLAAR